jgi:hypothetical protein
MRKPTYPMIVVALTLTKADAGATAVLVDEFEACRLS